MQSATLHHRTKLQFKVYSRRKRLFKKNWHIE